MEKKFFQSPTIYVGEVSINVTDLERSLEFYRDFLGFKVLEQTATEAKLTADGEKAILTLVQPEGVQPKAPRTAGLYHYAILLPNRSDLAALLQHIAEKSGGNMRLGASDHFVSEALYFDDPDGNGIEIAHDRDSGTWEWEGSMVSMGTVALDAQGLLADRKAPWEGMPEDTIMGHIHLHVSDIEVAREFYINGIGYDVVTELPGALFTSSNGYHHHIGMNTWNGVGAPRTPENSVGLNWFKLVFPDESTRQTTLENVRKLNAPIREADGDYFVEDPSGNTLRFVIG
ncbi:VOC family protein [Oceanobacillus alkalisoli]|uniref:VOC family protein n=1 Tax=Oceanobacillus alkalisoli TaxID=2925113 RepID=UPI001EF05444|nr:VOC family protein [Oceanobacillus alkalisoli]MCF3944309.1 VOC family protein [Oceanobacillus alkalisoli]MCG5104896.1 VOC family protein [Oceanobacillus alkalisoli]